MAVVCCGLDRVEETEVMLKSAAALSHSPITFIVFTEQESKSYFTKMVCFFSVKIIVKKAMCQVLCMAHLFILKREVQELMLCFLCFI